MHHTRPAHIIYYNKSCTQTTILLYPPLGDDLTLPVQFTLLSRNITSLFPYSSLMAIETTPHYADHHTCSHTTAYQTLPEAVHTKLYSPLPSHLAPHQPRRPRSLEPSHTELSHLYQRRTLAHGHSSSSQQHGVTLRPTNTHATQPHTTDTSKATPHPTYALLYITLAASLQPHQGTPGNTNFTHPLQLHPHQYTTSQKNIS